jgi:ADP-ribose pyrophosphatase YjhB (NUDIX family)
MALLHRWIGKAARLWWQVRRPLTLGVRAVMVDPGERIALIRHTYTEAWYLPGGGVKKGESFETALHRELREEVGLADAAIERLLGVYHSRKEGKDDHIVIFVVRVTPEQAAALCEADAMEVEELRWFPVEALPENVSPATARRIAEYLSGATGIGAW